MEGLADVLGEADAPAGAGEVLVEELGEGIVLGEGEEDLGRLVGGQAEPGGHELGGCLLGSRCGR